MAEIGLGYGSEFQLMRFLGHHRNDLYEFIHQATNTSESIEWLDYPYESKRISGDGELLGIECFSKLENFAEIEAEWKKFWPQNGTAMNWDGIFTIGDTWYFVEAKAHKNESFQKCGAKDGTSRKLIEKSLEETKKWLGANTNKKWIDTNCYQLANRLAFLFFCQMNKIKARLLYIGFVKGFRRNEGGVHLRGNDEVLSSETWMNIWREEMETLGLNLDKMSPYISFVHPDCEPKRK